MNAQEFAEKLELPPTATVSVAEVRPGDTIVIEVPGYIDAETNIRMGKIVESIFPGVRAILLENGARMKVVRPVLEKP